ncbi:MAG: endolytic transglycosylase MltG [Hyphomicrobiales bacterium]|nr:endolytic transglycosylase MltG [Hyphomicrobiales bacterium]
MVSAFLTFVLVVAVLAIAAVAWLVMEEGKPGPLVADKVVNIIREEVGGSIADQLEQAGVIDSAIWFNLMTLFDRQRNALQRGEYEFRAGDSMKQVEAKVMSGKVVLHPLTIPEGLTSEQIVQRLRDAEFLAGDVKEIPREGSILPETYDFPRGYTRQQALLRMAKAQAKAVDEIWKKRAPDLPIKSPGEMVTLASIVEKETGKPDERPHVAGVFLNRLQKRMRLESDPTIVYGLVFGKGTLGHSITKAELIQPTPYNTYIIDGLPPGPIANPGKAALEAVANPTRTKDLYFVADGTGGHVFSDTLDQHLKNVARWRQIEKDAKDRLAPDVTPQPPAIHGEIEPVDPALFGALTAPAPGPVAPAGVAARLAQIGAGRQAMALAVESLAAPSSGPKSVEELGAVVAGVNDAPAEGDAFADEGASGGFTGAIASYPVPRAMLADQTAREAKYGTAAMAAPRPAVAAAIPAQAASGRMYEALGFNVADAANPAGAPAPQPPTASGRPRIYDASEGTRLDPLLNKTYDLSYAKVVPTLTH